MGGQLDKSGNLTVVKSCHLYIGFVVLNLIYTIHT